MSRQAWERIVQAYESYEPERMFDDRVCLHTISKVMRGRAEAGREDVQECETCTTLKRFSQYKMEIESGDCDSKMSRGMLNGVAEGEAVSAFADGALDQRGGISGRFKWAGSGATVVGRNFAILNAGTHHDPVSRCEECHAPGHAEGWLRGAIVDGDCTGCRIAGAITYNFKQDGEVAEFEAVLEGLLICQCDDD